MQTKWGFSHQTTDLVPREDGVDIVFTGRKTARSDKAHGQIDE